MADGRAQYIIEAQVKGVHQSRWTVSHANLPYATQLVAECMCEQWAAENPRFEYRWVRQLVTEDSKGGWVRSNAAHLDPEEGEK